MRCYANPPSLPLPVVPALLPSPTSPPQRRGGDGHGDAGAGAVAQDEFRRMVEHHRDCRGAGSAVRKRCSGRRCVVKHRRHCRGGRAVSGRCMASQKPTTCRTDERPVFATAWLVLLLAALPRQVPLPLCAPAAHSARSVLGTLLLQLCPTSRLRGITATLYCCSCCWIAAACAAARRLAGLSGERAPGRCLRPPGMAAAAAVRLATRGERRTAAGGCRPGDAAPLAGVRFCADPGASSSAVAAADTIGCRWDAGWDSVTCRA